MSKIKSKEKEQEYPKLFLLLEQEKDRMGGDARMNILSIYKSQADCDKIIETHKNKGQSKWGFKIPENHEFAIQVVPREIAFDCELPSSAEDMAEMQNALEQLMSDMDKEESSKESQTAEE
mgnify:CR=1 FL=1